MFVQFNFAAFLQAVFAAAILIVLFQSDHVSFFESIGVAQSEQLYIICYFLIVLFGVTEIAGLKGRVYWVPSWLFIIVLSLLGGLRLDGWLQLGNAMLVLGMGLAIFKITDAQFVKRYTQSKIALRDLEKFPPVSPEKRGDFWAIAQKSFIYPSHLFLFFYPVYRLVSPNSIKQMDFVQHNLKLISKIKPEVTDNNDLIKLREFEAPLELAVHFKKYKHPGYALTNLKKVIKRNAKINSR